MQILHISVKCFPFPHLARDFAAVISTSLAPTASRPPVRSGGYNLMKVVYDKLRELNVYFPASAVVPGLPPW